MFCYNCGSQLDEGAITCKGCDTSVREELLALSEKTTDYKCEKCGWYVKTDHAYCSGCGEPLPVC